MSKCILSLPNFKKSGMILASCLSLSKSICLKGITPIDIDKQVYDFIIKNNATPAFLGYSGHKFSTCISVNDEIVHGSPSNTKLKVGDVITIDIGVEYKNHYTDAARTYIVEKDLNNNNDIIKCAKTALDSAILKAVTNNKVGDISYEIQKVILLNKYHTLLKYGGHGIGSAPHMEPFIPNYGKRNTGPTLSKGKCIAIEPIVIKDNKGAYERDDGCVVSRSGCISSHIEDTIYVGNTPIILTNKTLDGDLV